MKAIIKGVKIIETYYIILIPFTQETDINIYDTMHPTKINS